MKPEDETFLQQSKKLLDESVDSLDAATLSRLNQARQKALNIRLGTRRTNHFLTARTGAVFASFAVAAVVVLIWTSANQQQPAVVAQQYEDLEMLTADADLDLLEDLEFVSWLVEADLDSTSPDSVLDMNMDLNDAG
jgi:hypothetical protein